jgi:hypothetical protein
MITLDRTLELFGREEPDAAVVQDAQRKLEARIAAAAPRRRPKMRAGGWLAAAASALAAVAAFIWLPLAPVPALAFSAVQAHFRDFQTLRFEIDQRVQGRSIMKSRISVLANGSVRAEVGEDVVVVVNTQEKQVLTLTKPARMAVVFPLDKAGTKEDALAWLDEVRNFQGKAGRLSGTRMIRGERAYGWKLPLQQGSIVLWANDAGLPLEMQLDQGPSIQLSFRFEFEPELPAELFATTVPAGYNLAPTED